MTGIKPLVRTTHHHHHFIFISTLRRKYPPLKIDATLFAFFVYILSRLLYYLDDIVVASTAIEQWQGGSWKISPRVRFSVKTCGERKRGCKIMKLGWLYFFFFFLAFVLHDHGSGPWNLHKWPLLSNRKRNIKYLKNFLPKVCHWTLNSDIRLGFRHSSSVKTCARQIKAYFEFAFTLKRPNKVPRWDINEGCVLRHILKVNTPFSLDVLVFDVKSRTHSI